MYPSKMLRWLPYACLPLALASCMVGPEKHFRGSEERASVDIIGFYGNSQVVVHRTRYFVSHYEREMDDFSESELLSSRIMLYDPLTRVNSDSTDVPISARFSIRGRSLYIENDSKLQEYDFVQKKLKASPIDPQSIYAISAENGIYYQCDRGIASIKRHSDGVLLYQDWDGPEADNACSGYRILTLNGRWMIFNTPENFIRYLEVRTDGAATTSESKDIPEGAVDVQDVGLVPYIRDGDSLRVPDYFDPDGKLGQLVNRVRYLNLGNTGIVSPQQGLILRNDSLFDLDGQPHLQVPP